MSNISQMGGLRSALPWSQEKELSISMVKRVKGGYSRGTFVEEDPCSLTWYHHHLGSLSQCEPGVSIGPL